MNQPVGGTFKIGETTLPYNADAAQIQAAFARTFIPVIMRQYRTLDIGGLGILQVGFDVGLFWFRLFGYGLRVKDPTLHPPLFSERNGHFLTILGYRVRLLK